MAWSLRSPQFEGSLQISTARRYFGGSVKIKRSPEAPPRPVLFAAVVPLGYLKSLRCSIGPKQTFAVLWHCRFASNNPCILGKCRDSLSLSWIFSHPQARPGPVVARLSQSTAAAHHKATRTTMDHGSLLVLECKQKCGKNKLTSLLWLSVFPVPLSANAWAWNRSLLWICLPLCEN